MQVDSASRSSCGPKMDVNRFGLILIGCLLVVIGIITPVDSAAVASRSQEQPEREYDDAGQYFTTIFEHKGVLTSPGYPRPYPPNSYTYTSIKIPTGYDVKFRVTFMDIQNCANCTCDYLLISAVRPQQWKICGDVLPQEITVPNVTSTYVYVTFSSDSVQEGGGFYMEYEASPPSHSTAVPGTTSCPKFGCLNCPHGVHFEYDKNCIVCRCNPKGTVAQGATTTPTKPTLATHPPPRTTQSSGPQLPGPDLQLTPNNFLSLLLSLERKAETLETSAINLRQDMQLLYKLVDAQLRHPGPASAN